MKTVLYEDEEGFKQRKVIKNNDTPSMAKYGLPAGPPDLRQLDVDAILREINDNLVANELFTWDDVQRFPGGINAAVNILRRKLIELYRNEKREAKKIKRS